MISARLAWRSLRGRPRRFVGVLIATMLCVAFVVGVRALTTSTEDTLEELFQTEVAHVDVVVRRSVPVSPAGRRRGDNEGIPIKVADGIRAIPGVAAVESHFERRRSVLVIGSDGQPASVGLGSRTIASNYPTDPDLSPFTLSGRPPRASNEVVLDADTAAIAGVGIGDPVGIRLGSELTTFSVVGTVTLGSSPMQFGRVLVTEEVIRSSLSRPNFANRLEIRVTEPGRVEDVRQAIDGLLRGIDGANPAEAVTGSDYAQELQGRVGDFLAVFSNALFGLSALAGLVGAFIVFNTFSILVTQKERELALLAAVGARRSQLGRMVVGEAAIAGALGGGLGLPGGYLVAEGLGALFRAFSLRVPSGFNGVEIRLAVIAPVGGALFACACALIPAIRASRVAPIEAMVRAHRDGGRPTRLRFWVGVASLVVMSGSVWRSTEAATTNSVILTVVGLAFGLISAVIFGPFLMARYRPSRGTSVHARLAGRNCSRHPKRASASASSLMIGVAVVAAVMVVASTLRSAIVDTTASAITADVVITADPDGRSALAAGAGEALRTLNGIEAAGEMGWSRQVTARGARQIQRLVGISSEFGALVPLTFVEGRLPETDEVAVPLSVSTTTGLGVGSTLDLVGVEGSAAAIPVVGVFEDNEVVDGDAVLPLPTLRQLDPELSPSVIVVDTQLPIGEALRVIRAVPAMYGAQVQNVGEYAESQATMLNTIVGVFLVLVGMSVVVAIIGIANALSLSIIERTREIGLLRAVGAQRRQIRSMVRTESVVIALSGAMMGLVVGVPFGALLANNVLRSMASSEQSVSLPWTQMLAVCLCAGGAGVLAAIGAQRGAARVQTLAAIGAGD